MECCFLNIMPNSVRIGTLSMGCLGEMHTQNHFLIHSNDIMFIIDFHLTQYSYGKSRWKIREGREEGGVKREKELKSEINTKNGIPRWNFQFWIICLQYVWINIILCLFCWFTSYFWKISNFSIFLERNKQYILRQTICLFTIYNARIIAKNKQL